MSSFPSEAAIQPPVTVGAQKTNLADWLASCKQLPGGSAAQSLTIASGTVTPAAGATSYLKVDTEASASSDNLDHIDVSNLPEGSIVILQAVNTARTVVARNAQGGSGQILTATGASFSLDDSEKVILLHRVGVSWVEFLRGYGADSSALRSFLGLGTAALVNTGTSSSNVPTVTQLLGTVWGYNRQQYFSEVSLTDGATINWNLDTQQAARVTINGNRTLASPSNMRAGSTAVLKVIQGSGGARNISSYGSAYEWVGDEPPDMSGASAGQWFILSFYCDGSKMSGAWQGPYN